MPSVNLRINEIFHSLQGESRTVGLPTTFVRLTGCPLRCGYCDTEYAFHEGSQMAITDILATVKNNGARHVCVTGGEPLAQPNCLVLLRELCDAGFEVSIETSGAMDIASVDPRVSVVMDLKTPGSNECDRNLMSNITHLKLKDQVKFVICDRRDYDWAKAKMDQYDLRSRVDEILFSPSFAQVTAKDLAEWILTDRLAVRMQLQLHKFIWGDEPGH
ncbi:MAG: 7-carboxy-7-deazaguanine synthase QueE [Pseudohongiella nitratireducens]|nr:7-carboxy-7-deazaguanine synthase QueE [Pseudohongiella nitratireducens]MDF1623740.1 7-carboxy-7-deazaguanine synthase QueE [Pseudohongiella nitratireducens]